MDKKGRTANRCWLLAVFEKVSPTAEHSSQPTGLGKIRVISGFQAYLGLPQVAKPGQIVGRTIVGTETATLGRFALQCNLGGKPWCKPCAFGIAATVIRFTVPCSRYLPAVTLVPQHFRHDILTFPPQLA